MDAQISITRDRARIVLAHGGGGELTSRFIRDHVLSVLDNDRLRPLGDGAILPGITGDLVFTTDSYVVTPLEFPGGDIGRLAVAGTVNDLAVMGATPLALSLGLIIEEGLSLELLDRIMASVRATADEAGVEVVTGDTKVIERRGGDGLFINTSGVGRRRDGIALSPQRIEPGDAVLINGGLAEHGLAVMSVRSGVEFQSALRTDAAPLNALIAQVLDASPQVKFIRDATRGGVAGVLADICDAAGMSIEVCEDDLPIGVTARHAAEMLGLDPLTVANEGKVVIIAAEADAARVLQALQAHPYGRNAARIGTITRTEPPLVELITHVGGRRIVQRPYGEELPRIC